MTDETNTSPTGLLYLDDLVVGRRFLSGTCRIDAAEIVEFARRFDPQPYHLDESAARASLFGGLAASGWHTASITMRLLVESDFRIAGGVIGVEVEVAWPQPTRAGDILQVEMEVLSTAPSRSRQDRGTAIIRSTTRNERGEALQIMTSKIIVPRRTAP